jgi:hypothetical protein
VEILAEDAAGHAAPIVDHAAGHLSDPRPRE